MKVKARTIIPSWPRGRSTSSFTGAHYGQDSSGRRYRETFLPWPDPTVPTRGPINRDGGWYQTTTISHVLRRDVEQALESDYHARQQGMVDNFRARYRTLTEEDLYWLRASDGCPLKDAMKEAVYQKVRECPEAVPPDLFFAIKSCSESDTFWYKFRAMQL